MNWFNSTFCYDPDIGPGSECSKVLVPLRGKFALGRVLPVGTEELKEMRREGRECRRNGRDYRRENGCAPMSDSELDSDEKDSDVYMSRGEDTKGGGKDGAGNEEERHSGEDSGERTRTPT